MSNERSVKMDTIKILDTLLEIQEMCIGEIAMGYKLDPEYIGSKISDATGMNIVELREHLDNKMIEGCKCLTK